MDEARLRHVALGLAALLLAGFAVAGWMLDLRPAPELRGRALALEGRLVRARRTLEERPRLEEEIAALEASRRAQALRLPEEARLDEFVADAGLEARRHGVRIVGLQPGEARAERGLGALPVRLTVEGDFERIYAWMVALETSPRLARILGLQAHTSPESDVRAELQLGLFTAPESGVTEPAVTGAPAQGPAAPGSAAGNSRVPRAPREGR